MKIIETRTEIECNAEELRQSNTVADGLLSVLRRALNGGYYYPQNLDDEEQSDNNEENQE